MTITITHATPANLPELLPMIRALCAFHGDPCEMGLVRAQSELIDSDTLVPLIARRSKAALGFCVLERHWRPMSAANGWDIAHLYVQEGHRNQGVGRALIEAARDHALRTRAPKLTIGTSPVNPGAAAAYRAMGLIERGGGGASFLVPLD